MSHARIAVLQANLAQRFRSAEYHELRQLQWQAAADAVGEGLTVTGCHPSTAVCGGADFTLSVEGTGFTPESVILFNGGEEPTTYVSASELTTGVKPSLVLAPVVVPVSVVGADAAADFTFTAAP